MNDDLLEVLDGVDDDDPCFVHVSNIIQRTMKIKHDKWAKLMATIQYKVSVVCNARAFILVAAFFCCCFHLYLFPPKLFKLQIIHVVVV